MRRQVKLSAIGETMRFASLSLSPYWIHVLVAQQPGGPADLILVNGRVYTVDAARPWAEAAHPRVAGVALGTNADAQVYTGAGTRTIDLKGRSSLPDSTTRTCTSIAPGRCSSASTCSTSTSRRSRRGCVTRPEDFPRELDHPRRLGCLRAVGRRHRGRCPGVPGVLQVLQVQGRLRRTRI